MKEFNVLVMFIFVSDNVNENDIKRYSIYTFHKVHDGGSLGLRGKRNLSKFQELVRN